MSFCRAVHPPVTSSATILRFMSNQTSHQCKYSVRVFSSYGNSYSSSKRDMQTASAYQPHSLPSNFPLPRNTGVPDTSIAADFPQNSQTTSEQKSDQSAPSSMVSLREEEAQKSKPADSPSTASTDASKSPQKPRRKLRARKAAIKLTPLAIEQLHKLLSQPDPRMIRVGVKNKGCSGLAYHLEYVDKPGMLDEVVEQDGVKVLIDSKALFSIIGSEMDWIEDKLSQRFIFKNPNISKYIVSTPDYLEMDTNK
ncbi:assembly protein [Aspergillus sclerotialis]|uniref:Assembly protein n=1 Tax=Aspergillus sclerotialis TaxID=2070753 RepID=A0A3A2ZLP5_9EURO|nr:assembly protein [Aspergillus sclerotialis]